MSQLCLRCFALFLFLLLNRMSLFAQTQIPENGFENWTSSSLGTYDEPSGGWWTSLNSLKNLGGPVTLEKTTDSYSGNFAARMETKQWGTFLLPGLLVSGEFVTTSPFIIQGQPFSDTPLRFKGHYKYNSVNSDSAAIFAMLTRRNGSTGGRDTIAEAKLSVLNSVINYTEFDIPFNYFDVTATPDSIDIVFSSSSAGQNFEGQVGSTLFIDDVILEYGIGVEELMMQELNTILYPNPAYDFIYFDIMDCCENNYGKIFSLDGKFILSLENIQPHYFLNTERIPSGRYILNIYCSGALASSNKFEISH